MTNRHSRGGLDRHRVGDRPLCPCGGRSRLVRPGCGAERQRGVAATEGRARRWHRTRALRRLLCAKRESSKSLGLCGPGDSHPWWMPKARDRTPRGLSRVERGQPGARIVWSRLRRVSRSRRRMSRPAGPQARGGPGSSVPVRSVYPGRRARHLDGVSAVDRRCGLYRRSGHTQGPTPGWARRFTARLDISPDQCDH